MRRKEVEVRQEMEEEEDEVENEKEGLTTRVGGGRGRSGKLGELAVGREKKGEEELAAGR